MSKPYKETPGKSNLHPFGDYRVRTGTTPSGFKYDARMTSKPVKKTEKVERFNISASKGNKTASKFAFTDLKTGKRKVEKTVPISKSKKKA